MQKEEQKLHHKNNKKIKLQMKKNQAAMTAAAEVH